MKELNLKNGEWAIDNSPHRYGTKVRYKWEAVNSHGSYRHGYARNRDTAEYFARKWANG